ncbi:MAG: hypothetical protein WC091_14480 [Sulfuricellaceae bacterium]
MSRLLASLFSVLCLLSSVPCYAHSDEYLDSQPTPHGGQMHMAGPYHFELLAQPNELTVYLTDHAGAKIPSSGATGNATVLSGKTKASIKLQPSGDNVLKGSGQFELAPDMKVVVSVTMPGKSPEQARFTPQQKAAAMPMRH